MIPPQAAASLAFEKKTLIRKQKRVVATEDNVKNSQMMKGSLYFKMPPYCKKKYENINELWVISI